MKSLRFVSFIDPDCFKNRASESSAFCEVCTSGEFWLAYPVSTSARFGISDVSIQLAGRRGLNAFTSVGNGRFDDKSGW
jgi:hypothetical protein